MKTNWFQWFKLRLHIATRFAYGNHSNELQWSLTQNRKNISGHAFENVVSKMWFISSGLNLLIHNIRNFTLIHNRCNLRNCVDISNAIFPDKIILEINFKKYLAERYRNYGNNSMKIYFWFRTWIVQLDMVGILHYHPGTQDKCNSLALVVCRCPPGAPLLTRTQIAAWTRHYNHGYLRLRLFIHAWIQRLEFWYGWLIASRVFMRMWPLIHVRISFKLCL